MGCGCGKRNVPVNPAPIKASHRPSVPVVGNDFGSRVEELSLKQEEHASIAAKLKAVEQSKESPVQPKAKYGLLNAIKDTVTGNAEYATLQTVNMRRAICGQCPFKVAGICSECGCVINLKIKFAESSCPVSKW